MRRNYAYGRRRRKSRGWLWIILLILIGAGAAYLYFSPLFERQNPKIELKKSYFWNPHKPILVTLKDNRALGSYQAVLSDGTRQIVVASGRFEEPIRETQVTIRLPKKSGLDESKGPWRLSIIVRDRSLWNFGRGNETRRSTSIVVDTTPPVVGVVAASPSIIKGGSALVIFKAVDPHLKEVYLQVGKKRFEVLPYKHKGYWATLMAWPFRMQRFRAKIVAIDTAGNRSELNVPIEEIDKKYRVSWIRLSDRFLKGKIAQIAAEDPNASKAKSPLKRFRAVNEGMRVANENLIHRYTAKPSVVDYDRWKHLKAFYPLKHAMRVANFGDERHYYYTSKDHPVSLSYHLGYDLASTRHAPIYSSNSGQVVFASRNGIYGNMPIIDHGFGLYTIYGHCSSLLVEKGDRVKAGEVIAKTGKTGLAMGDHLHFGMLVQGIEVLPMDWMKQNWIKSHITAVFRRADRIIASQL